MLKFLGMFTSKRQLTGGNVIANKVMMSLELLLSMSGSSKTTEQSQK